jgi:hypothetical protein
LRETHSIAQTYSPPAQAIDNPFAQAFFAIFARYVSVASLSVSRGDRSRMTSVLSASI